MMRRTVKVVWFLADKGNREVYRTLMKDIKFQRIWRTAREDDEVKISNHECLKWNEPRPGEEYSAVPDGPREDGHYDVEGHSCSDVSGRYRMRWWHPGDLKDLVRWIYDWVVEDVWDTLTDRHFRSRKSWKIGFDYVKAVHPFKRTFSGCCWVVNSMHSEAQTARWEHAEKLAEQRGFQAPDYSRWIDAGSRTVVQVDENAKWYAAVKEIHEELESTWTKEQTIEHIETSEGIGSESMVRLNQYLWVNKHDPMVFVLDEELVPFDMKSGWSQEALCRVIQEWFREMLGEVPAVRFVPYE